MNKILIALMAALSPMALAAKNIDIVVKTDTFSLPGVLTVPDKVVGKVPCVVFVHGSGANDRDETIGPNKVFKDIADSLSINGIASLRYDKRTLVYGEKYLPQGAEANYYYETVADAVSAVETACNLPEIDSNSVYVLGHSLGAMLAPEIAQKSGKTSGLIMLAPPAQKILDLMLAQCNYLKNVYSKLGATQAVEIMNQMAVAAENGKKIGNADYDEKIGLPQGLTESYIKYDNEYNPVQVAESLSIPIFMAFGFRDYQVPFSNYNIWLKAMSKHKNANVKIYFNVNHIMREGVGEPSPLEYNEKRAMSPQVMKDIITFIKK